MAELLRAPPLGGVSAITAAGFEIAPCPGAIWRIGESVAGAVPTQPGEWMLFEAAGFPAPAVEAVDVRSGHALFSVSGPDALLLLDIDPLAGAAQGGCTARVGGLRASLFWRRDPVPQVHIAVERFYGAWFWEWLRHRATLLE
ncbi:hypothetical protein [Stakelama tenebrarum]|uniref:Sarcosine oxidase subunit gamma n=1 Tax=Stakelama tenebrarum TaxID=2711215 RepID=A0A6G6Y5G2_9SPHN|nr:hypothetical protein [Sphingosinithalassobacter tenebrarum]QIG80172.1 hypothetical protein G5C33_10525 [Sphingosinithalassobacter tenebrarum]